MPIKRDVFRNALISDFRQRDFFWGRKKKASLRPGALNEEQVRNIVKEIGLDKKILITRIDAMGDPEDVPVEAILASIRDDYFAVRVVNPERKLMEASDSKTIYLKGGGGLVDYHYTDGDIKEIIQDVDEEIMLEVEKDAILEIINALEIGDEIRISYFDPTEKTAVNCIGSMLKKFSDEHFIVLAKQINEAELSSPQEIDFDINSTPILDIQIV